MIKQFENSRRKNYKTVEPEIYSGIWINELGSEMNITADGERIKGKYKTGVGDANPKNEFDLVGFVSNGLISFSVNFGENNALTGWVGHYSNENGTEIIKTMWLLARYTPPEEVGENQIWGAVWNGYNNFVRKN